MKIDTDKSFHYSTGPFITHHSTIPSGHPIIRSVRGNMKERPHRNNPHFLDHAILFW